MRYYVSLIVVGLLLSASQAMGQTRPATASSGKLTVAILNFEAQTPGSPELGKQISEALAAMLSAEDGFTLVDRASVAKAFDELELNLTGMVSPEKAVKVGQLVGAKLLVTGKAFTLDKQLYITAKIIGTETSLVDGLLVKGDTQGELGSLVAQLSQKLTARLREVGPKLVAGDASADDPLPALKAKLANRKLPKVTVRISERHVAAAPAQRIDPAAETEVRVVLQQAGFTVVEGDEKDLAKAGVDVIISGEALSEFAARIGNLVSCAARIEIKVTPRLGSEILHSDRETTRAADLSENIAAKNALQKGGRTIGIRILEYFANNLPASEKPAEKKP